MPPPTSEPRRCSCGASKDPTHPWCLGCLWQQRLDQQRYQRSGLPPEAAGKSFAGFHSSPPLESRLEALEFGSQSFYLFGPTGSGKTHLLFAASSTPLIVPGLPPLSPSDSIYPPQTPRS